MGTGNEVGRKVVEHEQRGSKLHLFVQPRSHQPALYIGQVRVADAEGDGPMRVELATLRCVPHDVLDELGAELDPG